MPDDPHRKAPAARRRGRRFVVRDPDDHGATAKIEAFLSGPRARGRTGPRLVNGPGRVDLNFDTRTDFAAALDREAARTERYGRPATVLAVEFEVGNAAVGNAAVGNAADGATDGQLGPRARSEARPGTAGQARQIDRLAGPIGFTLRREARDTDRITRVAPNRFHVLLPETSDADAERFIERARRACEVWFAGAAIPVRLKFEAASTGRDLSLTDALAIVEGRISA